MEFDSPLNFEIKRSARHSSKSSRREAALRIKVELIDEDGVITWKGLPSEFK